ncbi:MAG: 7-carboxy-7-deazaguanine synthase QueE [Terracidiphilus sp.]|jgi:7-carboxy-7-deazaguanine synthase (Cx14CxxC type)
MYSVKEIFYTLQGEGAHTGRAAVFLRFAGCNLWSGREADRGSAICRFCDTDFADTDGPGGGKFASAQELAAAVDEKWLQSDPRIGLAKGHDFSRAEPGSEKHGALAPANQLDASPALLFTKAAATRFVVCTGGEPLLQLDPPLIDALHARGFEIAVETNGTIAAPRGLDWICVSPKAGAVLKQRTGDELKLVYPQPGADPVEFESLAFRHFFLQPMDGPHREANTQAALKYCLDHPRWRLSLQTHKLLGIS